MTHRKVRIEFQLSTNENRTQIHSSSASLFAIGIIVKTFPSEERVIFRDNSFIISRQTHGFQYENKSDDSIVDIFINLFHLQYFEQKDAFHCKRNKKDQNCRILVIMFILSIIGMNDFSEFFYSFHKYHKTDIEISETPLFSSIFVSKTF